MGHAPDTLPWIAGLLVVVGGVLLPLAYMLHKSRGLSVRQQRD